MPIATSERALPGHSLCDGCGFWADDSAFADVDGKPRCVNCAEDAGYEQCAGCEKLFADLHDCDGDAYCDGCADDNDYAECSNCHTWHDDLHDYDGDKVCNECVENLDLQFCDGCEKYHACDDVHECDNNHYCERCMDRKGWSLCYNCGDATDSPNEGADDEYYCSGCWENRFSTCEGCGCVIWNDDAIYTDYATYCESCAPNDRQEYEPKDFDGRYNTYDRIGKRCFGIEIETDHCDGHSDYEGRGCFGAKPDGSVNGMEFYSSILSGDKGLAEVAKLCDYANDNGWGVNEDCGLHVHFDMRSENLDGMKAIAYAMLSTYDVWRDFVEDHRHDNSYCHTSRIDLSDIYGITDFRNWSSCRRRYEWCNFRAYSCHSTFEVRLHHGSINGREICNWTRAISLFMDWASRMGWAGVRNALLCKDTNGRYEVMCKVWKDAGCDDLVEWFDNIRCAATA